MISRPMLSKENRATMRAAMAAMSGRLEGWRSVDWKGGTRKQDQLAGLDTYVLGVGSQRPTRCSCVSMPGHGDEQRS